MRTTLRQVRAFNRPVQLLLANQLTINIGFYMLMPYLADHLSTRLALAAWAVGLILGVRNFSQQGMFLLGGSLADRLGYKPMILAGLGLRVIGFALLGLADSLPALVVGSTLTGLAGALFNPAVRAYLAAEAGDRKVEAFAVFNVFYQAGILIGPLIGLALLGASFRCVCLTAAGLFLLLMLAQWRALPPRPPAISDRPAHSMLADWRQVISHRPFVLFSLAMIGSYVLNFQVYLGLPIEVRRTTGGPAGVAVLFAISGLVTIAGQVPLTTWAKKRWTPSQAIARGLILMGAAFMPLVLSAGTTPADLGGPTPRWAYAAALAPAVLSTLLLTVATMIIYPFEMATIVALAGERLVGTYYGFYNTMSGIGIAAGNLLTGIAIDTGRAHGIPSLPWLALTAAGLTCAAAVTALDRNRHLHTDPPVTTPETSRSYERSPQTMRENVHYAK